MREDVVGRLCLFHALQNLLSMFVYPLGAWFENLLELFLLKAQEYLCRQDKPILKDML